jgi:hypothetical protein
MNEDVPMDDDDLPDIVLESSIQAEKLSKNVDQQSLVVEKKTYLSFILNNQPDTYISVPALQSCEPTASSKVLAAESTDTRVHNVIEADLS